MTQTQIKEFLESLEPNVEIRYVYENDFWCSFVDIEDRIIYINKATFFNCSDLTQRCYILHELGHIYGGADDWETRALQEFSAQHFAIAKAYSHK